MVQTPHYNEHPNNMDSSYFPGKNKLQMFDGNKLPLLQNNEDTKSTFNSVSYKRSWLYK